MDGVHDMAEALISLAQLSSQGHAMIFLERPISGICIALAVALMLYPVVRGFFVRHKGITATE